MPGPYNPGQAAIRVVTVNPDNTDVTQAVALTDGSVKQAGANGTSAATSANPAPTRDYGFANIATNQVSVALTATQIVPARSGRGNITITNTGTNPVYIGVTGVTPATGHLIPGVVGASFSFPTQSAVFGIATGTAQTVTYLETF